MGDLIVVGLMCLALLVSALFSQVADRRLFARIKEDEEALADVYIFNEKSTPIEASEPSLVSGSVVIGVSYFRTVVAGLKGLFGGRVSQYEVSMEGARRQALIRMQKEARARGATMVFNVRLETSSLTKKGAKQDVGAVEVLAYGTAIKT